MSKEQIDPIIELLTDFDEMGFAPTTTVPDPEAYAIEWRNKLTEALQGYRKQSEGEWIKQGYENIMTRCSKCGNRILWNNHGEMVFGNFCLNCGASMKGGAE